MKFKKAFLLPIMLLLGMLFITNVKASGFNVSRSITGVTNTASNTFTYTVTANNSTNPATVTPPSAANVVFTSSTAIFLYSQFACIYGKLTAILLVFRIIIDIV